MIPLDKIKKIVIKYETLEKELASGNISKNDFVKKSKEYSSIGEIIDQAKDYLRFDKEKNELEKIIEDKKSDKEILELAKSELNDLLKKKILTKKFLSYILYQRT